MLPARLAALTAHAIPARRVRPYGPTGAISVPVLAQRFRTHEAALAPARGQTCHDRQVMLGADAMRPG